MRGVFIFVSLISWTTAGGQSRGVRQQLSGGPGWDIRLAVPGDPGNDYPTLGNIPRTSFSCSGKAPGYYADLETNCQAFRVCTSGSTYGFQSFLCPNGTLFNQAVFVCDWWMNVNCQKSQDFITSNNDKFGNLKLGPQLMKDVRKMITHPMRNPYDKTVMKSNLIVMQDYRPPLGQMYMTGSLILSPVRQPNSVYVAAKQIEQPFNGFSNNVFAASTPSPTYVPPPFNSISSSQTDNEFFQRQRQNEQYQRSQQQSGQYQQNSQRQNGQYQQSSQKQNGQYQNGQYQQSSQKQNGQYQSGKYKQSNQNGQYQNGQYQNVKYQQSSQKQNGQYQSGQYQQSQRQNGQYQQSGRLQSTQTSQILNGHAGQFSQNQVSSFTNTFNNNNALTRPTQLYTPAQYRQNNAGNSQTFGQIRQSGQYTDGGTQTQQFNGKPTTGFGVSFSKQQYANSLPQSNSNTGQINTEAKQNLVSNETPATIITKTVTFNRIVDPEPGKPKSRITIKTWIVKPTKSAKLIAEPTSYNYPRPTNPPSEKQIVEAPYIYNPPTTPQTERIITEPEEPYSYNKPTVAAKQVEGPYVYNRPTVAAKQVEGPYVYNRPTVAAKQIVTTPSRLYLTPTLPPPTLSRLYLNPTTAPPTVASKLYIPPTTYKPAAKLYLPPAQPDVVLSRQYLPPNSLQQSNYQSEQLQASPTSPTPVYAAPPNESPSFSLTKHSHINANHNNLTFADILTKEKLDITVNDIVSDTSKVLKTASPQLEQYNQDKSVDYSDETYIQTETNDNESGENLTPQSPTVVSTSSRLIQGPSIELEPPVESFDHSQDVSTNRLANLPFYKEPATNTIERTVSLKISIPEKVASYLFKNRNDSDYDKLEILNTGSSNYLVLTNNLLTKNSGASFIPIGRLIADKKNISDSQALVFNFLADSLNAAKEYSSIAKQNIVASTPSQFQAVDNQQLTRITNQISQLTASQYSNQNNYQPNIGSAQPNQDQAAKYTQGYAQNQQINSSPARLTQGYSYNANNGLNGNLQLGQNQIYSGQLYQLPVPDVTSQIYNVGANYVQNGQQTVASNGANLPKQSSAEVEIVSSQTLPIAPAKLQQFTPSNEAEFNSHEHSAQALFGNFLNNGNGISAQLQDKIVGTIPHPLEDNKLVTYKKDQSYYFHTKLNGDEVGNGQLSNQGNQNAKLVQNNGQNIVLQFVPSVSYQLEDEKEQQRILNAFQIDEYGSPKKGNNQVDRGSQDLLSEVDYSVEHPHAATQVEGNAINTLYAGPSSYSAPQASVGSLEVPPPLPNNLNARLEQLEENNGYGKVTPARQFNF